jgi:Uma2 family endonuclease
MKTTTRPRMRQPLSRLGELTWEVAQFFPAQGEWTEADYLGLQTNHLVELSDGCLEILPMPTHQHQMIVAFLYGLLKAFVDKHAPGTVLFAPLRMRLWEGKFREPDLLYMRQENQHRIHDYWDGADLVMEVVSPGKPEHDRATKRLEYAKAGIAEYWIVDVIANQILVLALGKKKYRVHGQCGAGTWAESKMLPGFAVPVDQVLAI